MTNYAVPPRIPVIYTQMVSGFVNVAQTTIHMATARQQAVIRRYSKNEDLFNREILKISARSVLLETQGRASRYQLANWPGTRLHVDTGPLKSTRDQLQLERRALEQIGKLHLELVDERIAPLTKISGLLLALSKRPITSIRQLADDTLVSEATAQRWLKRCRKAGILVRIDHRGQGQYVNPRLLAAIDEHIKIPRFAGVKTGNYEGFGGA